MIFAVSVLNANNATCLASVVWTILCKVYCIVKLYMVFLGEQLGLRKCEVLKFSSPVYEMHTETVCNCRQPSF